MIYIVNGITLRHGHVLVRDASNKLVDLPLRQGDLDGACAVYCCIMALLRIGYIDKEADLCLYKNPDRRTPKGKILYELLYNNGLVTNGLSYQQLKKTIQILCGKEIKATRFAPKDQEVIDQKIVDLLDAHITPIISVQWPHGGAHALLAIGYEYDEYDDNIVKNILCLDPSSENPKISAWNCYIDVSDNKGEYPFYYTSSYGFSDEVKLGDILTLMYYES